MKTNINMKRVLLMGVTATFLGMGCALTEKLPSVTVGGAANKSAVIDASVDKSGISVTVPLVSVSVPFPKVEATGGKKK
tara:strand:- start:533 stop:769 length:237 start_codon:yes stop_codon:yes gene_type:complete